MKPCAILPVILAASLGYSAYAAPGAPTSVAPKLAAQICPVYLRYENSDGTLQPTAFLRPEHVISISLAKPLYPGNKAIWIKLTPAGSERLFRETKDFAGSRVAIFCGTKELERAELVAPIKSGGFRVDLPDGAPNDSFKPNPLRGSA